MTYRKGLPPEMPYWSIDSWRMWLREVTRQIENIQSSLSQCLFSKKTLRVVKYRFELPLIVTWRFIYVTIFTFIRLMSTKLGRVLTSRSTFRMQMPKLTPTFGFPFSLLISCRYVWTTWQNFFVYFLSFITVEMCCQYRIHLIGNTS